MPSTADLDAILVLQLGVAFAGERAAPGHEPPARLGWWNTDLVDEFGGHDLLASLLPETWRWAALEGAREAARRTESARFDAALGRPDLAVSLFRLGYDVDEQLAERLLELKRSRRSPSEALPALAELLHDSPSAWSSADFLSWLNGVGVAPAFVEAPAGREVQGAAPASPRLRATKLALAAIPLASSWPCPHFRLDRA
jgi:hypothetical protein